MFPVMKNAYLQHVMTIPPRLINRMVNVAMCRETASEDLEPPFLPGPCPTPYRFAPETDPTRARPAFLHWALPKLIRELHSGDIVTRRRAFASLSDILRDPEKAFEAIKLDIVPRLADLLLNEESYIRERSCFVLGILANHSKGGKRVLTAPNVAANIQNCLNDIHPMVQTQAANTIEILSRIPWVCDEMLNLGFPDTVNEALREQELQAPCIMLLEAMHNMISRNHEIGCDLEIMDLMVQMIQDENDDEKILGECCKILGQIGVCQRGQLEADEKDLLPVIINLLYDERSRVHTNAAMAFQSLTISTRSCWRCREFQKLPRRLTELAAIRKNVSCQIYAVQSLLNICCLPVIRETILEYCAEIIKSIETTHNKLLARLKARLLKNIHWVSYDISSVFDAPDLKKQQGNEEEEEENGSTPSYISTDIEGDEAYCCPCSSTHDEAALTEDSRGSSVEKLSKEVEKTSQEILFIEPEERTQNVIEPLMSVSSTENNREAQKCHNK